MTSPDPAGDESAARAADDAAPARVVDEPGPRESGGEATDHQDDGPARRRSRSSALLARLSLLSILGLAALLTLVLLTGYLAWQWREQRAADDAREQALNAARTAAAVLFAYDHRELEKNLEDSLALTTGKFQEDYEKTARQVVHPVAEQYDVVVEAEVAEAAVVSARSEQVVTVVFINQTTTSTRVDGPKIDQSRVRMTLTSVDGEWRVADVEAL